MIRTASRPVIILFLAALLVLSGCARKLPLTVPVPGAEEQQIAQTTLQNFLQRQCTGSIDADVTAGFQVYGRKGKIAGILQMQKPSLLRFSVVDPLGRPLYILVSDGATYTLADNRNGTGYEGPVDSGFLREFVPESVEPGHLFSWLSGQVESDDLCLTEIRKGQENKGYWFIFDYGDGLLNHLLLDEETAFLTRRLVVSTENELLLDVTYSGYEKDSNICPWPGAMEIKGDEVEGTFTLRIDRIYSREQLPDTLFNLVLPEHFSVQKVQ